MFLDFLEKRSEEVDDTPQLTDEEKLFLKVFGIEEDQPAAAMKEVYRCEGLERCKENYRRSITDTSRKSGSNYKPFRQRVLKVPGR